MDSLHEEPLVGALIQVEGTNRIGPTDSLGRFLIDSIPPGTYRLVVDHPLLDTLGITLVTPPFTFAVNEITRTVVAVPGAEFLTGLFCPAAKRTLGPGALIGRVREPDTEEAAVGARVSFVWYDPDPPGLPANLKIKKVPRVRETVVSADGTYRLCGLPATFEGKLQAQRKDGGATAEVIVSQSEGVLALRSMSVAALPKIAGTDSVQDHRAKGLGARVRQGPECERRAGRGRARWAHGRERGDAHARERRLRARLAAVGNAGDRRAATRLQADGGAGGALRARAGASP